jgi:DNA adenine methylase
MPYLITKQTDNKYKVCKKDNPNICFSNKTLSKKQAEKQMKAIIINETNDNNILKGGLKSFIARMGGKSKLKKEIVNNYFFSNYQNMTYVEPFLGGGSIFFYKEPSIKEIVNDLDQNVITVLKGLKKYKFEDYENLLKIKNTKSNFFKIKDSQPKNSLQKYIKQLLLFKMSFFAMQKSFDLKSDKKTIRKFNFKGYQERLKNTIILNEDYKKVIKKYDSENTFFYLDPPYSISDKSYYKHFEFNINELYEILKNIKGKFLLSFDNNDKVKELFKNYNISVVKTKYEKTNFLENREKEELLIYNYDLNKSVIPPKNGKGKPKNQELYDKIKDEIYKKNPKHSLFRSAQIVKEYKKQGGEFEETKKPKMNIDKWFNQNWISANDYYYNNEIVPCGSSDTQNKFNEYPLCRPKAILEKLTKPQIKKMLDEKNKLKEKPLITEKILNTKTFNIKSTNTGLGNNKFFNQLNKINLNPQDYLKFAKLIAKHNNYNPDLLEFADNNKHKLQYNNIPFGAVNYNDFIIYNWLELNNKVSEGTADLKRKNYRKRAKAVMEKTNNKNSRASLSFYILW